MIPEEILYSQNTLTSKVGGSYDTEIQFPFKWQYGKIVELSQHEKEEFNRPRRAHHKRYQKGCVLCGEQGAIEFRKMSNGNSSLICRECAEKYVHSANAK